MKLSSCGKSFPNKTVEQNAIIKEYTLIMIAVLLLTCVISIIVWVNSPATTFFFLTQNAYGIATDNGPSIPKAFLVYSNQRYEMTPFVHFDGKYMNKLIYPSADVTPLLTVQEGDKINVDFDENPVSVKAYIVDYEADIPSLHALKELPDNNFELSGVQGLWNIEVHAVFSNHNGLGSSYIDNKSAVNSSTNPSYRYVSYELGVDMMPMTFTKNTNEIGRNTCANNDIGIAKVSTPGGQLEHPGSINYNLATNYKNNSINSNILSIESIKGNSLYIIDLGQETPICSLKLKFSNGDKVVNHFNIQTSIDGNYFSEPIYYDNTGAVSGEESYDISSDYPITTRYVKITFEGNTQGNVYAPLQVRVLGNN